MKLSRRDFAAAAAWLASVPAIASSRREVSVISAPVSLGLRPGAKGQEPGAWRAPEVLLAAGLADKVGASRVVALARPTYDFHERHGTRIRNGDTLREFMLELGAKVRAQLEAGRFPLVLGGDCSVLLGCLYGARLAGGRGLVHVDGHSDFFHPGNYDTHARLGSAAGMDLALATGRGEQILTRWPGIDGPLVADDDAIQAGERDAEDADYDKFYGDIVRTSITRHTIQQIHREGIVRTAERIVARLSQRGIERAWLHVDLDVLDEQVMNAVDSPGTPGFDYAQLSTLLRALIGSGRVIGLDVCIYDPDLDPGHRFAKPIVDCLVDGLAESTADGLR
ncbi:MAG TPA: arginase family protein [Steroidobacteraceae bacterium]|nr:arginase family protein [Steroidobacteraceae bacterium]